MDKELQKYIEESIIPQYDNFDKGHQRDHAMAVIRQAMDFCKYYDVNEDMVYVAAACHDLGLCLGRETHHLMSGKIIREDKNLAKWFSSEQLEIIAEAAEDHRASSDHEPRSIYGKIIAEADRQIVPETVIKRTIQFSLSHYPDYSKEQHWERTVEHINEKYSEGGYLKLWIPESPNAARLAQLRKTIKDKEALRAVFEMLYEKERH